MIETWEKKTVPEEGQDDSFEAFYAQRHRHEMRRAVVLTRTPEAAADAVHEAFVDVYRNWSELRHPHAYLRRAVVSRCRDDGRRASSRERLKLRLAGERATKPAGSEAPAVDGHDDELWQALIELPFNQRAAIVLRYFGGHSEVEIADLLDCSTGSVGPWISRGLTKLRRRLSQ
jgi:RNA polymerase sigma factor (sigma-70 family)